MDTEALKRSLLSKFVEVTGDRLQKIQLGVIAFEKPDAARSIEEVARELHTMKGEARMLGLKAIGQVAHASEDLLAAMKAGRLSPKGSVDHLLGACDQLADLLDDLEGAKTGTPASLKLVEGLAAASGAEVPPLDPVKSPPKKKAAPPAPKPAGPPADPGDAIVPPAPRPSAPPFKLHKPDEVVERRATDRTIRVNIDILDSLGLLAGDLLVDSARNRLKSDELAELLQRFSRVGDAFLRTLGDASLDGEGKSALERLESDLHLLRDDAFKFIRQHSDGINTLHSSLSKLADNVAEARLVPLASVFDAFPRLVRDIAQEQGKKVELSLDSANAGVDRSLVSDVRDALIHLLKNAVDHGIEAPEFRVALGKQPAGRISLRVRADGDMLHVSVEDDGRGMDPDRIRQVAVVKGLVTEPEARALSDREALELVFAAGFSTREEVSDVSGRGVGMDVVKQKVESLGGAVSLQSRVGLGSVISLRLPQSLALMRVLLIRLGDDVYGIPAADVEAVARFRGEDRMEVFGSLAVMHRGKPVSLVALGPLLALNGGPRYDRPPALVIRHGEDRAALVVDGFIDEREVAVKPCGGEFMKGAPFVAGAASLEDGRVAVLLQVADIMFEVRRMARPVAESNKPRRLRVLLVDDSPIARAAECALLKALGHSVDEAQDGEEAWARANQAPYDLIVSDVQMPRVDGYEFTKRLKSSAELKRVPVIILSSLSSPEDKRRGIEAGADAYLIKGELGVESIAQTIDRLV